MEKPETLNVRIQMAEGELAQWHKKNKEYCIACIKGLRRSMSYEQLETVWKTLTSKGGETLIYGQMPDPYEDRPIDEATAEDKAIYASIVANYNRPCNAVPLHSKRVDRAATQEGRAS